MDAVEPQVAVALGTYFRRFLVPAIPSDYLRVPGHQASDQLGVRCAPGNGAPSFGQAAVITTATTPRYVRRLVERAEEHIFVWAGEEAAHR
jgi:hypothetical protein